MYESVQGIACAGRCDNVFGLYRMYGLEVGVEE